MVWASLFDIISCMTILRTSDNDFTIDEVVEYENRFVEKFEEIFDDSKPQTEKIAYVAYMKARRDEPSLDWDQFLDDLDGSRAALAAAAFGEFRPETEEEGWDCDSLRKERALRMARWCLGTSLPPSEYLKLTYIEQQAFIDVIKERNSEMKKGRGRR